MHIQIIHFIIVYLIRTYQVIIILPITYRKLLHTNTILQAFESHLLHMYVCICSYYYTIYYTVQVITIIVIGKFILIPITYRIKNKNNVPKEM